MSQPLNTDITYDSYDNYGHLLQYHKPNDVYTSFIWGYNNTYPIAKVVNATSDEVIYSSFETSEYDEGIAKASTVIEDATMAKIGNAYLSLYGTPSLVTKTIPAGTYKMTYWANGDISFSGGTVTSISSSEADSKGWKFYEKQLVMSSSANLLATTQGINLDDLKIYPSDAQMSTYTYKPLVGMTSETGPDGVTIYYYYDDFNRLKEIRDHEGYILKEIKYNYAQ